MLWTFSIRNEKLSNEGGWSCEARSTPIAGHTPMEIGTYAFDQITYVGCSNRGEGVYFIAVNTDNDKGLHGGGSLAPEPYAAQQGWYPTEGCIRVQNIDLLHIVVSITPGDTLQVVS